MQHEIEKYVGEGRFATARSLVDVGLPSQRHAAWHAAIDILQHGQDHPCKALALDGQERALTEARVRKAFK